MSRRGFFFLLDSMNVPKYTGVKLESGVGKLKGTRIGLLGGLIDVCA
jgi:hypothetical protein